VLVGLKIALDVDEFEEQHFGALSLSPYVSAVPRSSLRKRGVSFLGEGIIDIDYRGEIHALLFNHTSAPVALQPGEAVGQFILCVSHSGLLQVERRTAERGAGGFGSTGRGNE
jgi:dUTP pyrophosphatase